MKEKLHPHKIGLVLGTLLGLGHLSWSFLVAIGLAKPLMNWLLSIHFISLSYSLEPFAFGNAVILIVVAAVWGYVVGYVFALIWNWMMKNKL